MEISTLDVGTSPPEGLVELAESVRGLAAEMIRIDSGTETLAAVRSEIDDLTRRLASIARKGDDPRILASVEPGVDDLRPYYPANALTWHCNPAFPPLRVEVEGNLVRGTMNLDLVYEGPPGCVHGGVVSLIFDQLLGHANGANGTYGMTAELKVTYHRPTPLFAELEFEAQVKQVEGRKVVTEGWISSGGERTASAVGLFVLPTYGAENTLSHISDEQVERIRVYREQGESGKPEDNGKPPSR